MDKRCCQCKEVKPIDEFGVNKSTKDGRQKRCKPCARLSSRKYYENNKEKQKQRVADWYAKNKDYAETKRREWRESNPEKLKYYRKKHALKKRGYTFDSYQDAVETQGGKCAICKTECALFIDHDHRCCPSGSGCPKCVRGLLCDLCNFGLGSFKDNPDYLRSAIEYLDKYDTLA